MRRRVLLATEALGYQPDLLARSLRQGSTKSIGFVVRDISNPLFSDIAKGAEDTLREAGYSMVLTNSEGDPNLDAQYIQLLRQRRVDGLILSLVSEVHGPTIEALKQARLPFVLLDREVASVPASFVLFEHYTGVRDATAFILEQGHRRVAILVGPAEIRATRERLRGYLDAHRDRSVPIDERLIRRGSYTRDFGYQETRRLLALSNPPTAILAGGIQLSTGSIVALSELKLKLGRDMSLVACDEIELMRAFDPPISVVLRDTTRMGALGAELLIDMLAGGQPRTAMLPTTFVPRASVGSPTS